MRMISELEMNCLQPVLNIPHDRAKIPSAHVGLDIDTAGGVLPPYNVWAGCDADVGHIAKTHVASVGCVEQEFANASEAVARLRRGPHHHVVNLAVSMDIGDLLAREDRGGRPTHIARLEPKPSGLDEIDRDLDLRHFLLQFFMQVDEALDTRKSLFHVDGMPTQDIKLRAEDAHHDRFAGAGQHLFDPLPQIGLDVAVDSGVAVDRLMNGVQRLVVVGLRIDTDPILGEVDANYLVSNQSP